MVQNDEKVYGVSKERLELLFDVGTFVELGAYTRRPTSPEEYESVVCGYGAVDGKLVFAFAQDSGRTKGAFGERHARKIADMYSLAVKNGAPVVGVFDSAGAVVYDGASALAAYGKVMKCVSDASGVIPQIAVIDGVCGGSAAVIASMFDLTVTIENKSKLYVNSPFAVGDEILKKGFSSANGLSAAEKATEADAFAYVKQLLGMLPQNNAEGAVINDLTDDINRLVGFDAESYDPEALMAQLSDNGRFVRVYKDYAENLCAGFAVFGGVAAGVVASDPKNGGVLDINAARVAAKLVSFCDSFSIPVVTLVNSEGLDVSAEAEGASYASELSRLAMAYASAENAKLTVVMGKAYGAAFTLLGSKSVGADMAYALEGAAISVLSPEASVAFVWNDKVGKDGATREEVEAEWKEKCASAAEAAERGEIDDVIEASELRKRICAALSMLAFKAEGKPSRRHAVMPL
ncbi:MAG: hypothetical protein E7641_00695 [Ruminococcaceae bacterium]|nr:hypothetical protein [Oscillospiraceae bacterium]